MGAECITTARASRVLYSLDYEVQLHFSEHTNGDGDYTSSLLGVLVMQDVHLGLLVALLPALAGQTSSGQGKTNSGMMFGILQTFDRANNTGIWYFYSKTTLLVSDWPSLKCYQLQKRHVEVTRS